MNTSSRTVAWIDLPDDMRCILGDFLIHPGTGDLVPPAHLQATQIELSRLPFYPLDDEHAPLSEQAAEDEGQDRGVAYALRINPVKAPPIVLAHDWWLDGRHRVYSARARGDTHIWAFDLTGLVAPRFNASSPDFSGYGLGGIQPATEPQNTPSSRRRSAP